MTSESLEPSADDSYYLVVPLSINREGSYGTDSTDAERPQAAAACLDQESAGCL